MKILFVDEDLQVEALVRVLRNRYPNDKFNIVSTLAEARDTIWSTKFDVLVIDIMLLADESVVKRSSEEAGLIAGLLLIDLIKQDERCANRSTPVILLTGVPLELHQKIRDTQTAEYKGRYFQKPILPDTFYANLKRVSQEESK